MSCMTNTENDTSPKFESELFKCPHCGRDTGQKWTSERDILYQHSDAQKKFFLDYRKTISSSEEGVIERFINSLPIRSILETNDSYNRAECARCGQISIWVSKKMVYPLRPNAPEAHEKMLGSAKEIYEEARLVEPFSKRAAAALLRLSLEKLTKGLLKKIAEEEKMPKEDFKKLEEDLKNMPFNKAIGELAKKGLPQEIIQMFDIVRITGNDAVHAAGQIDLEGKDTENIVYQLFSITNEIVERMIATPERIAAIYSRLPEGKKEGVASRDNKE